MLLKKYIYIDRKLIKSSGKVFFLIFTIHFNFVPLKLKIAKTEQGIIVE